MIKENTHTLASCLCPQEFPLRVCNNPLYRSPCAHTEASHEHVRRYANTRGTRDLRRVYSYPFSLRALPLAVSQYGGCSFFTVVFAHFLAVTIGCNRVSVGMKGKKDFHLLWLQYVAGSEVRTLHSRDQQHRSNEAISPECEAWFRICAHQHQLYVEAPKTSSTLIPPPPHSARKAIISSFIVIEDDANVSLFK